MYSKKVYFYLPGFCGHFKLCEMLAYAYTFKREMFYDNVEIRAFYDSPNCIWNGGRLLLDRDYDLIHIKDTFQKYNIPVRFTFTNSLLQEKHLSDKKCNLIAEIFNTGNNEILCNSSILESYLRETYGNDYRYISSITKCLRDDASQQDAEISKNYFLTVMDFDWNNDFDFLEKIQNKEKCEILADPCCIPNCPNRQKHYQAISEVELYGKTDISFTCSSRGSRYYELRKYKNYISPQDIEKIYLPLGFNHFKLEGRQMNDLELIEVLVDYLIKDEYKLEVRSNLQTVNHPLS